MTTRGEQHAAVPHLPEAVRVILRQFASRLYEPVKVDTHVPSMQLGSRIGNALLFSQLVSATARNKTLPPEELAEFRTLMTQVNGEIEQYFTMLTLYGASNKPNAQGAEKALYFFGRIYVEFSTALEEEPDAAWNYVRQAAYAVDHWLSDRTDPAATIANELWRQCMAGRGIQHNPRAKKQAHFHMKAHVAAPEDHGIAYDYRLDFDKAADVTRFLCATQVPLTDVDVCEEEPSGRHHRVTLRDLQRAHRAGR